MTNKNKLSVFDSAEISDFMALAIQLKRGDVTLYLSERRMHENNMVEPPDGEYKRIGDTTP